MVSYLNLKDWIMFSVIGVTTGVVAFGIDIGVKYLSEVKFKTTFSCKYQLINEMHLDKVPNKV